MKKILIITGAAAIAMSTTTFADQNYNVTIQNNSGLNVQISESSSLDWNAIDFASTQTVSAGQTRTFSTAAVDDIGRPFPQYITENVNANGNLIGSFTLSFYDMWSPNATSEMTSSYSTVTASSRNNYVGFSGSVNSSNTQCNIRIQNNHF